MVGQNKEYCEHANHSSGYQATPSHAERYHLIRACEDSLHRLKTDHIDIYTMHAFEPLTRARMKPPPQSADPRSLEGVPLRMGDVPHGLRAWRAGHDLIVRREVESHQAALVSVLAQVDETG